MQWLLFLCWAAGISLLIHRWRFFRSAGLRKGLFIFIFLLYVAVGCLHVWIAWHYYPEHGDVWNFFHRSLEIKKTILYDPGSFGKYYSTQGLDMGLTSTHSGWTRWQYQLIVMIYACFNFLSLDNVYTNTLLFSFLTLIGKTLFFKVLNRRYPQALVATVLLSFFVPSVVFWSSPIHKDGILIICFGLLLSGMDGLLRRRISFRNTVFVLLSLVIIFMIRKLVLLSLLPALILWVLVEKWSLKQRAILLVATVSAILFILVSLVSPISTKMFALIASRQSEFMSLEGGSKIVLPLLTNSAGSFFQVLPYALLNGFLMPLPGTGGQIIYSVFGLETLFLWLVAGWGLFLMLKSGNPPAPPDGFRIFSAFFAVSACLVIGYIIPFAGAIIRYRSIFLPFLFLPFFPAVCVQTPFVQLHQRILALLVPKTN